MLDIIYSIIIYPLVQIIGISYKFFYKIFDDCSISIFGVSLAVSFLCLPLYIVAERWQQTERNIQSRLKPKVNKIKAVFSGDEQFMILSALYRQNHYRPLYTLRSSFGILIQIPFFIAAYNFLSHFEALQGESFLFIKDMAKPDAIWNISGFSINILPLLMTAINCISGWLYTKKHPLKDKIQVYGTALIFLALLYNSPAALVVYWTANNIFSLVKNIFYKLKKQAKALYIVIAAGMTLFVAYLIFLNDGALKKRAVVSFICILVIILPLLLKNVKVIFTPFLKPLISQDKIRNVLFMLSCVILTLLAGICIPAQVISSSPSEFSFIDQYQSPFNFVFISFFQALGIFIFWPCCLYALFGKRIKTIICFFVGFTAVLGTLNSFVFTGNLSGINNTFNFTSEYILYISLSTILISVGSITALLILLLILTAKNKLSILCYVYTIVIISIVLLTGYNSFIINGEYKRLFARYQENADIHEIEPVFHFSKTEKNLIVFMADAAINGYVKPIFDENPKLYEIYDGFVRYPNTVSFNSHTLIGVPPVWGGYEYTPKEMNERKDEALRKKHNEALLLIPKILSDAGWNVTVADPSWANHEWIPNTSIYNNYKNVRAFNTKRRYTNIWFMKNNWAVTNKISGKIERNMFYFTLFRMAPPILREEIYDDGWYWDTENIAESSIDDFINSYAVLDLLPELTDFQNSNSSAVLITNETTHDPVFLQYPDYIPVELLTDKGNSQYSEERFYHINSAFYLRFGEWLNLLKENGVYDNTRIVVVSDHGAGVNAGITDFEIPVLRDRLEKYNPVLLFKDFNAHGELQNKDDFMTTADVPVMALQKIIDNPINPFTGNILQNTKKENGIVISINHIFMAREHPENVFKIKSDEWIRVRNNIFNPENWSAVSQ